MPPKKKSSVCLVLPCQKTLFSFVGRDGNNNFDPDDSVRKETENMIDSGSQDVQVPPTLSHQIVMLTRKTSAQIPSCSWLFIVKIYLE